MVQLVRSIMGLYCLTGDHMNIEVKKALENHPVSAQLLEEQRARVTSAFNFSRKEHAAVETDIRWWIVEQWHDGTLEKELLRCDDAQKVLATCIATGEKIPIDKPIPGVKRTETWSGVPVKYVNGGYPGSKRTITLETALGSLTASEEYASRSFGITEYPVKNIDDLRIARQVYEQIAKSVMDDEIYGCAPMTPIQILLIHLAGVENTVYLLMDHQQEVEEFLEFIEELFTPVIEALAKKNKVVFFVENYSSEVSGGYFEQYIKPVLLRRREIAKKNGAMIGVHHDGKLMPMVGWLKESGVGYINGITAAPSGDAPPEKIRELVGEGVVIADIYPQSIFMNEFKEEEFVEYIRRVAEFYKDDYGVIYGIGDMLPCVSDIRRYERMISIIEEVTRV